MEIKQNNLFLAGLIHRIRNFYERTGVSNGEDFYAKIKKIIGKIPEEDFLDEKEIFGLVDNYYKPETVEQAILRMSDCWSSGKDVFAELKKGGGDLSLYSIFNSIKVLGKKKADGEKAVFPIEKLTIEKGKNIPFLEGKRKNTKEDYLRLWKEFLQELDKLPTDSLNVFGDSFLYLLKKYTWCMPAETCVTSDVSLYEYTKTSTAFVDCFSAYYKENKEDFRWNSKKCELKLEEGKFPVILVGGDLSGIQKFIYNISSQKAAKSLKGRSFYLQLAIDSIIQRILEHKDIQAHIANVIYSSGGKFYMLLPNLDRVKTALKELKEEFDRTLWEEHKGRLSMNLDSLEFAFDNDYSNVLVKEEYQVKGMKVGGLWKLLAEKLTAQKNQKFKQIVVDDYESLFNPISCGGKINICAVTGDELRSEDKKCKLSSNDEGENIYVLPSVKAQSDLGRNLKDLNKIVSYSGDCSGGDSTKKYKGECIDVFGLNNRLLLGEVFNEKGFNRGLIKTVNNTNFLKEELGHKGFSYGFQFYGGNRQAQTIGGINKDFSELANGEYLGILRMDVDNLGSIFIKGFDVDKASFSAYANLSFLLDYFFSGYLNTIREEEEFRDNVNILYSGGDDIFAIGKWDSLLLFSEKVREEFRQFCMRDDISISGGIIFVHDKFPISKSALLAGEKEDAAKDNKYDVEGKECTKNSINLFNHSISWKNGSSNDFKYVKEMKEQFVELNLLYKMPTSILHKLKDLYAMKESKKDCSYLWNTTYYLSRFSKDSNDAIKSLCNDLMKTLFKGDNFEKVVIAARWAELEIKFKEKK